jgi:hypothetical protein
MTGQELDAYGRIAEAMATHILSGFMCRETFTKTVNGRQVTIEAPYFFHRFRSDLENCAELLWSLGILRPLDPKWIGAHFFAFDCEPKDFYATAIENAKSVPTFDQLLGGMSYFISCNYSHTGNEYIEIGSEFMVRNGDEVMMKSLVALGYAEPGDSGYMWTQKTKPILDAA